MNNKNLNLSAFHDYDIRGIYPTEINEAFYYQLGKSLAKYFKKGPIAVGRDIRLSSESLAKSLIDGITDVGVDVVDLGLISTEMHNFASGKYNFEGNVMISASHNPPEYNGTKILKKGVIALHGSFGLDELKNLMHEDISNAESKGKVTSQNIFDDFIENALKHVDISKFKKLKVVVDAGNAMGGPVWEKMKETLPLEIIPLNLNPDGNFPNHIPDPIKDENTADLKKKVLEEKADLGIALDGDADRVFFMDETGEKLSGTVTTAIFVNEFIKKGRKGTFLYNASIGRIVKEIIEKGGSKAFRCRNGHSFIKEYMRDQNIIFGGENSCHFFFKDNFYSESTLIAGLMMIEILSESEQRLSEIRKEFDIYPASGEINFVVKDSTKIISDLKEIFKDELISTDEIDGTSFWFKDFWFITRNSKTEPLMRLNVEADNKDILERRLNQILEVIENNGGVRK